MLDTLVLRLLERTAENLQLVQSAGDVRQVGQRLQEDVQYLRARFQGPTASLDPIDLDTKT